MTPEYQHLAALVYDIGMKKQLDERVEAKYLKLIEYLVNENNELMYELEQRELELVTVESELVTIESELVTVEKECYGRGV